MPNIKLKDSTGNEIIYSGITTITVPSAEGDNVVTFAYQQEISATRLEMQEFLDSPFTRYTFPFKDGFLLSSDLDNFGLWYVTDYDAIKLHTLTGAQYFFNTPVGCLCAASSNTGLVFVDLESVTATRVMGGYSWQYFYPTDAGCLVFNNNGGISGIKYFQYSTKSIVTVYPSYAYFNIAYKTPLGWLISCVQPYGVFLFNESTLTATRVYTTGSRWQYFMPMTTGCFIGSTDSNTGLLYLNYSTGTVSQVYATGYGWSTGIELVTGSLALIGGDGTGSGLISINLSTLAITSLSTVKGTYIFQPVLGGCLTGVGNLYYYDIAAGTYTVVKTSSSGYWQYFQPVEGGCLCSNPYTSLHFFDEVTKTVTTVYSSGTAYRIFQLVEGGCLCSSSAGGTAMTVFYDYATRTCTATHASTRDTFHKVPGGYLCTYASGGILFFNTVTKTFNLVYSTGGGYYTFIDDANGCTTWQEARKFLGMLYWDNTSQTITAL